jgi:hypothetical protein
MTCDGHRCNTSITLWRLRALGLAGGPASPRFWLGARRLLIKSSAAGLRGKCRNFVVSRHALRTSRAAWTPCRCQYLRQHRHAAAPRSAICLGHEGRCRFGDLPPAGTGKPLALAVNAAGRFGHSRGGIRRSPSATQALERKKVNGTSFRMPVAPSSGTGSASRAICRYTRYRYSVEDPSLCGASASSRSRIFKC